MDPETKELLKQNLEVAKQNNIMLAKLVRTQKWTTIYRVTYWAIIILSTLGAFYFLKPLLGNVLNVYTGGLSGDTAISSPNSPSSSQQMQDFLNSLK